MKILIVEDEALVAQGIELTLAAAGHDVVGIAPDLPEAVRLATAQAPDMAFVDMKLAHGSNGLDVARELRTLGVACVFATANPPDPSQAKGLGLGFILKPFNPRLLTHTAAFVARALAGGDGAPTGFQHL